jgi:hypothetical protein
MDGIALLAEGLDHGNALGRYKEFIRLLEQAFASKAGPGLTQFLVPFLTDSECPHGFAKREIHTWVDARPKAAHADHRPTFLLEGDVRPWINRMEEAAYDVLLNKAEWRAPSSDRRDVWRPVTGSMDGSSGIFVSLGAAASLSMQVLDGFRSYPLLLAGPLESALRAGVWVYGSDTGGVLRGIGEAGGKPAEVL